MATLMRNKLELCGRLCADPELKNTPTGIPCTTVTLAVQRPFKNSAGKRDTDFFVIDLYKHHATFVCKYIKKGESLFVDGWLRVRSFLDPVREERRYKTEIVVQSVDGVDPRKSEEASSFDTDEFFEAALRRSYDITSEEGDT